MTYIPTTHKFVAVLNKKVPSGNVMNALGHATAGFTAAYPSKDEFRLGEYIDKDGSIHPNISDNPFIILQADNGNKLRTFRAALAEAGLASTDFTDTMTVGTYADQQERTKQTAEADLEYYCVVTFGPAEILDPLTKKFSLWRG